MRPKFLLWSVIVLSAAAAETQRDRFGPEDVRRAALSLSGTNMPFDHGSRTEWRRTPGGRAGKRVGDLSPAEHRALHDLLRAALSPRGYERAVAVMRQDDVLARARPDEPLGSGQYVAAIYGRPDGGVPWGWRLEGHHLSIRTTYGPDGASATPFSLGFEPSDAAVEGVRPLEDRERRIIAVVRSLTGSARTEASSGAQSPVDVLISERPGPVTAVRGGVAMSTLSAEQRRLVWDVVDDFTGDVAAAVRSAALERLRRSERELRIAFSGAAEPGKRLYFRVSAPTDLFEHQNIGLHIHSVWRSAYDFLRP